MRCFHWCVAMVTYSTAWSLAQWEEGAGLGAWHRVGTQEIVNGAPTLCISCVQESGVFFFVHISFTYFFLKTPAKILKAKWGPPSDILFFRTSYLPSFPFLLGMLRGRRCSLALMAPHSSLPPGSILALPSNKPLWFPPWEIGPSLAHRCLGFSVVWEKLGLLPG